MVEVKEVGLSKEEVEAEKAKIRKQYGCCLCLAFPLSSRLRQCLTLRSSGTRRTLRSARLLRSG